MDTPGGTQSYVKEEMEGLELKVDRSRDIEEWEGDDKRRQRSNKSRKPGNGDEAEGSDGIGRRRSTGDRNESRKRSSGLSRTDFDDGDYEARKESRSKQMKKQEESALDKLSSWYEDGEQENKREGERRKSISKFLEHDSSQNRLKGKDHRSHDRDSEYLEKRETDQEKDHGSSEHCKSHRKDDIDALKKAEEGKFMEKSDLRDGKSSDFKHESAGERSMLATIESNDGNSRCLDSTGDRGMNSYDRVVRIDSERGRSSGRSEAPEEDNRGSSLTCEKRSGKERVEKHREQTNSDNRDVVDTLERSFNAEADGTWLRDRNKREFDRSNRSLDRSARHHHERENIDMDRGISSNWKESEKEGYQDDRSSGRDGNWSDKRKEQEGSKDDWRRRQPVGNDKETKDRGMAYDHDREWEVHRHGRVGGRKDASRTEAIKTSSKYGISNENYDVIEIQTKPFDYNGEESRSTFARITEPIQQSDTKLGPNDDRTYPQDRLRKTDTYEAVLLSEELNDRYRDDDPSTRDQNLWRDENDFQEGKIKGQRVIMSNRNAGGQSYFSGSQTPHENQESGSYGRAVPQGAKGNRVGRGGRGRPAGRDNQPFGIPVPMMGSPFGSIGIPPPGPMQPLTPSMSHSPGPPISPSIFIPPFLPPVVWSGARGIEMNMLAVPQGLSPVPSGSSGPRFPPNIGNPTNSLYFNQHGHGRGEPPNMSSPGVSAMVPVGRGLIQDKASGYGFPPRTNGPPGKAPSRGEQNDYSQNFVDTGMRPQNFVRELELTAVVEDYPKLRELIQKKDEIVANSASAPMYFKCDLREHVLSPEFFGTKFDVILVDPPWEEYVHRAPGVTDHMEYWTFEEIMNLKIEAITDTPSFIFLWVGDGVGLEQGRQCLKKWGFRRCEDICWVKTNKTNATPGLRHDSHTLFQRSKEHCLMGIKGTVRRSTDGHIIHANIDTDVMIAEEPPYGSTAKPEDMYRIVEHFALGRRRLELFGEDHNIRSGWLTVGKGLTSSNFSSEAFNRNFADKDGKVWQGVGGRNPPPEAPHLVLTTLDIEALRPKSPMKNQQQLQQSASISVTTVNSSNRMQIGNSPQNPNALVLNQEASPSSNFPTLGPWAAIESFKGREGGGINDNDDRIFDMYGHNVNSGHANDDYGEFETHKGMSLS